MGCLRKGRVLHRWIARCRSLFWLGADTAVSIEREVVSGHAYAVLAPESPVRGWCGYDNPTCLSVDGVVSPVTLGPRRFHSAGALVLEVYMVQPGDTDMTSACRIIILEDQLEEALRHNQEHQPSA
jgi:hypothetical protein